MQSIRKSHDLPQGYDQAFSRTAGLKANITRTVVVNHTELREIPRPSTGCCQTFSEYSWIKSQHYLAVNSQPPNKSSKQITHKFLLFKDKNDVIIKSAKGEGNLTYSVKQLHKLGYVKQPAHTGHLEYRCNSFETDFKKILFLHLKVNGHFAPFIPLTSKDVSLTFIYQDRFIQFY